MMEKVEMKADDGSFEIEIRFNAADKPVELGMAMARACASVYPHVFSAYADPKSFLFSPPTEASGSEGS